MREQRLEAVILADGTRIETDACVLAIGHSARDTIRMLYDRGLMMQPKAFAVGVRIQHPQELINTSQWGPDYPKKLGAASYALSERTADGRSVYSFCMCPGGYIVNASSEPGRLAVNGMSYSGRGSGYANSAMIVSVSPRDFEGYALTGTPEALRGIDFQRKLELRAHLAADGQIPVQRFGDFKRNRISAGNGFAPAVKGKWEYADVRGLFPEFLSEDLTCGITAMAGKLKNFDLPDALLAGVETRTSSPVRILRDDTFQSSIRGLYPCGEGAGFAGGIVSAAVDGMKVAEYLLRFT